jgi:hypothetical protein
MLLSGRRQTVREVTGIAAEPAIVAWKDDRKNLGAPWIPGESTTRWHEYEERHGDQDSVVAA